MTIKLLAPYGPYLAGDLFKGDTNIEAGLVRLGMATADTTGGVVNMTLQIGPVGTEIAGGWLPWHAITAGRSIAAGPVGAGGDDGASLSALSTMTLTVPSGLNPRPTLCLLAAPAGQLTVTGNINGSVQSVVLTGSPSDVAGWCLCANVASDGYTLLRNH